MTTGKGKWMLLGKFDMQESSCFSWALPDFSVFCQFGAFQFLISPDSLSASAQLPFSAHCGQLKLDEKKLNENYRGQFEFHLLSANFSFSTDNSLSWCISKFNSSASANCVSFSSITLQDLFIYACSFTHSHFHPTFPSLPSLLISFLTYLLHS